MKPNHRPQRLTVMRSLPLALAATLALAACGTDEGVGGSTTTQVNLNDDRTYVARSVLWREGQDPIEQVVVRIEDEQVSLRAGCNELSTYGTSISDGKLLSDSIVGTDMGCVGGPEEDQDEWLGDLLGSEPQISITSEQFELRSDEASLTATSGPAIPR